MGKLNWRTIGGLAFFFLRASAFAAPTDAQVSDLVQNFKSNHAPVLFVFCRDDRSFHCLAVIRDAQGKLLSSNTATWSIPILADSDGHKPYNQHNGNTPQGVYTMDGVMPDTDNIRDYGHFRRIVLNFLPGANHDHETLNVLPESSQSLNWWKEASAAREMGRADLRIHGVGYLNSNPNDPDYPFIPTWGCLTTREGLYEGVNYQDQRLLLDSFMTAQGISPSFEHETQIKGYLVVLNINGVRSNVSLNDLPFLQLNY